MKKKWLWIVPGILAVAVIVFLTMLWFANKKSLSMTETVSFEAQYIRTDGYHESMEYPMVRVIHSVEELKAYYDSNKDIYNLERRDKVYADMTIGFLDACDKYNEFYFEKQVLVLILLEEGSGSIRHEVTEVELVKTDQKQELVVNIITKVPEIGTDDMAEWHIFVEPEPGVHIEEESQVTINLNGKVFKDDAVAYDSGDNALDTTRVSASHGEHTLSISIPEGWEYEIKEYSDESSSFGIYFWPEGETEGKLSFLYYDAWGVCGTGLEVRQSKLAVMKRLREIITAEYGNSYASRKNQAGV